MDTFAYLVKWVPAILEGIWMLLFFKTQFEIKIHKKWILWVCTPIAWFCNAYFMAWFDITNIIYKSLLVIGLTILWEVLFYKGAVPKKIFTALISNPLLGVFDELGIYFFQICFHASFTDIARSIPAAIFIKAAAIAAVLIFGLILKDKEKSQLQVKEWILLSLFIGLILSVMLNVVKVDIARNLFSKGNILNELALLVMLYLVFYLVQSLSQRHRLEQERALLQQQVAEEKRSVQALTETHRADRKSVV